MRIGLFVSTRDAPDLDELLRRFERAEAAGFHGAWAGQVFEHDALTVLALAGRATRRIELGSWVVPTWPRHPAVLAQQALTVQAACAGRLVLGIGVSHRAVVEDRLGLDYARPLRHAREVMDVLRPLLAGERAHYEGETLRAALRLAVPGAPAPPLLLAALGPRMLALAGERADGAAIWLGGPRYLERFAVPRVRRAAQAAGRPPPRIACGLPIAVTREEVAARSAAADFLARSSRLPPYRAVLEREGASGPADVALIGDETGVRRGLERLAGLGASDFVAVRFAVPEDPGAPARTAELLADLARRSTA